MLMRKSSRPPFLLLPEGATATITEPSAGDSLQIRCEESGAWPPQQPILGFALTPDGLALYLPGTMASQFRTSADFVFGFVQEEWFGPVPATITEIMVDEYAYGHLLLYRAAGEQELPLLRVA